MRTVAFDFSGLDHLNPGNGQYRYCIDLIRGLSRLRPDFAFVVIGSRPQASPHIEDSVCAPHWRYVHLPRVTLRGSYYIDQLRYAWLLSRERVDIFHTPHTFVPWRGVSRRSATRGGGRPTVVTVYDLMSEIFPEYGERVASRPYQRYKRAVQDPRCRVIAISQTTGRDLHTYWHVPAERVSVVPLGPEIAQPARPDDIVLQGLADTTFVLSPYNLEPRKNLGALLTAMADVRKADPGVMLVLYGRAAVTAEREDLFRAQVRGLGLDAAVLLTGFSPDASLAWLYRASSLFVFPTLYEGFGLPILEAMAAGACVVARNQSAMAEILADAGVQVETQDAAALAAVMTALLRNPARRDVLGRAAQLRASQYSQEAMARGTLGAYARALGNS